MKASSRLRLRGVLADGITTMASGAFSVFGVNISAFLGRSHRRDRSRQPPRSLCHLGHLRRAGVPTDGHPCASAVVGATLVFTSCAILKNGIQTIAARLYDTRKTLAVGLAIMAGLAVEAFPGVFSSMPASIHPVVASSLVFGTLVAFVLNFGFQMGQRKRVTLTVDPEHLDTALLGRFIEAAPPQEGDAWRITAKRGSVPKWPLRVAARNGGLFYAPPNAFGSGAAHQGAPQARPRRPALLPDGERDRSRVRADRDVSVGCVRHHALSALWFGKTESGARLAYERGQILG
jgi:hypothetical protein